MHSFYKTIGKILLPEDIKAKERKDVLIKALGKNNKRYTSPEFNYSNAIEIGIEFPITNKERAPQPYFFYKISKKGDGVSSGFYASLRNENMEQFKLLIDLANDERYKTTFIKGFELNDVFAISFLERINSEQRFNREQLTLIFKGLYDYVKHPGEDNPTNKTINLSVLMEQNFYEAEEAFLKENGYPNISSLESVYNQHIGIREDELKYREWLYSYYTPDKTRNWKVDKPSLELLSKIEPSLKSQGGLFKKIFEKKQDLDLSLEF